jgi:D-alanyl-lipoteichoic acid acyltransferase DltB (MBOAT superfamily)
MLFTTWAFGLFLVAVLALFYGSPRPVRRYVLLAASLFFYMCWNPRYVLILLSLITVDYFAAIWIEASAGRRRHAALLLSLIANLGFLAWFKYTNFLLSIFHPSAHPLDILLPLGISFHTFQSISYVVDVYRGKQTPIRSYFDYALFVAFFPQLVAGPIVRARNFFDDLFHWHPPTHEEFQRGVTLAVFGLAKKLICADQFSIIADQYFNAPIPGFLPAITGTLAFALQIFFDFSGYTDIAIGTALLFGFHFPENFRRPYLASSITEFWRRWHISLSSWLRDYLYIPLGGNRQGALLTYRNLLLTMTLGGLWHGASWNFVIWGAYHGVLLSIERLIFGRQEQGRRDQPAILRIPLTILTFAMVCVGWVFFRAKTLPTAAYVLHQMLQSTRGQSLLTPWHWRLAAFTLAIALFKEYSNLRLPEWLRAPVIVLALLAIELFGVTDRHLPFVYFQF